MGFWCMMCADGDRTGGLARLRRDDLFRRLVARPRSRPPCCGEPELAAALVVVVVVVAVVVAVCADITAKWFCIMGLLCIMKLERRCGV